MKILFTSYINIASFNDPEQWLERIKGYTGVLESLGKYHTIISIEQINYNGELDKKGVKYYFRDFKKKTSLFPIQLHRFIKKLDADIIVVHGTHFPLQVMQLKRAVGNTVKIIVQNHAEKPFNKPKSYLQKLADKYINAYIFTSEEMAGDWIANKIISDEKKVWGIMEGSSHFTAINKMRAKNKTGVTGSPAFLFVGRLDDNKDPLKVVDSFLRYNELQPSSALYMIYHTTDLLDEIKKFLNERNNRGAIFLVGKSEHNEMLYWYNSADFIISASHYEGSGIAVCEGMSCGCIPLLTNIPSFRKITSNGSCGVLYDINEADGLFNALTQTQFLNIEEEKEKVLKQFDEDLSFGAIAKQIAEKIDTL